MKENKLQKFGKRLTEKLVQYLKNIQLNHKIYDIRNKRTLKSFCIELKTILI